MTPFQHTIRSTGDDKDNEGNYSRVIDVRVGATGKFFYLELSEGGNYSKKAMAELATAIDAALAEEEGDLEIADDGDTTVESDPKALSVHRAARHQNFSKLRYAACHKGEVFAVFQFVDRAETYIRRALIGDAYIVDLVTGVTVYRHGSPERI